MGEDRHKYTKAVYDEEAVEYMMLPFYFNVKTNLSAHYEFTYFSRRMDSIEFFK